MAVAKSLRGVAVSEFNGDGNPDVVAVDSNTDEIVVVLLKGVQVNTKCASQ